MTTDDTTKKQLPEAFRIAVPWARARFGLYWRSARFWVAVLTMTAVTAAAGPYRTIVYMTLPVRLAYWALLLVPIILFALGASLLARETARRAGLPWALAALVAGIATLIAAAPYSALLQWVFGIDLDMTVMDVIVDSAAPTVGLTLLVNAFLPTLQPLSLTRRDAVSHVPARSLDPVVAPPPASTQANPTSQPPARPPQTAPAAKPASPLYDRLPPELGREIVCMRADNHHIEVTTTLGRTRILMRLGDAEADLNCRNGLRVHRSWWVNLAHVQSLERRESGTFELLTSQGDRIPVSRAQRDAVRAALKSRS